MNPQEMDDLLATVTPGHIRNLVLQFEPLQPKTNRGTVALWQILEELTANLPIADAAEQSPVEMRLRKAVKDAVGHLPDMAWVEGDG